MQMTKIINNEKIEQHLCDECSQETHNLGFGSEANFTLNQFLANLLNYDPDMSGIERSYKPERCENCGLTYNQFTKGGKLGCSQCYNVFSKKLDPLLTRIHSTSCHKGKVPERAGGVLKVQKEIDTLKIEMSALVAEEEFEKAAVIRDKIKELEKKLEG